PAARLEAAHLGGEARRRRALEGRADGAQLEAERARGLVELGEAPLAVAALVAHVDPDRADLDLARDDARVGDEETLARVGDDLEEALVERVPAEELRDQDLPAHGRVEGDLARRRLDDHDAPRRRVALDDL